MEKVNARVSFLLFATACLVGMAFGSALTFAFLSSQRAIPSTGLVVAVDVGVFSDVACTQNLTSIDWGSVHSSESISQVICLKNTGKVPAILSIL